MTSTRSPLDVLDALLPRGPLTAVDVGSGAGAVVRHLARRGGRVVGVEVAPEPLAQARAHPRVAFETYAQGSADALPLRDGVADLVLFMNSLHHVSGDALGAALGEAARVLRPGGMVYVQEPLAFGPHFDLLRPIDDETGSRAAAAAAVRHAGACGLTPVRQLRFDAAIEHADFAAFRDHAVLVAASRARAFAAIEKDLRRRFEETAERTPEGGFRFRVPMRVDLLRRAA